MLPKIATKKQVITYEYGLQNPCSLLCMDPRLGKTLVAISIQKKLQLNCLVICPGYLTANWKKEIIKWNSEAQITVFKKGSEIYEPCDTDFVVISYDLVQKAPHLFEWASMVVMDEIHNIKSMSAKRTQFLHKEIYENSIRRVHGLTGTPLKNRVREFYSLIALMCYDPRLKDPEFLTKYPDEITFAEQFSYRSEFKVQVTTKRGAKFQMPVVKYEGLRNKDELKKYLKGHYLRIKADEKDLPPIIFKDVLISDSPNLDLLKAFDNYFSDDGAGSVRPDIKVKAAMQKVPFTIKYAEDLLQSVDSVLIYSDHREPCEALARHFGVPAITGKMPGHKRARLAAEFQNGDRKVLCATIGSLKEGQDLFRSKDIILNDLSWIPGDIKQVINRIRGLGQTGSKTVHEIFGSPQDSKISEALKKKMKVIEEAT